KSCPTDVANPISINDIASPVADIIKIFFRPYLSPLRPQIVGQITAVINVTANTQPEHVRMEDAEKFPIETTSSKVTGKTMVMLPATRTLANHIIVTLRFMSDF